MHFFFNQVATPANWQQGGTCMVIPSVKPEELAATFPKVGCATMLPNSTVCLSHTVLSSSYLQGVDIKEVPSGKGYLRYTPQPNI